MRVSTIARALVIILSILFGVHYYFWRRLVHDTALPGAWGTIATAALGVLLVLIPVSMVAVRAAPRLGKILAWPAFLWLGAILLLLVSLLSADVLKLVLSLSGAAVEGPELLARVRYAEGAAVALTIALTLIAVARARSLVVREVEVALVKLPTALDGTVLVQLTDIHVGPTIGRAFMEAMVRRVNELKPDAVCITGDLADGPVAELMDAIAPLRDLRAKYGVFFVTGNHEYYNEVDSWLAALVGLGVRVLRNEHMNLAPGLDLAGLDDMQGRIKEGHGPDLAKALAGRDTANELVLLAHQPKMWPRLVDAGIGLVLSGHTHAGQIWPFNYLVKLDQPVVAGLVRSGSSQLYVSAGTGYWGPPMRLGSTAEITKLNLRSSPA